jgi:hypothetical protein
VGAARQQRRWWCLPCRGVPCRAGRGCAPLAGRQPRAKALQPRSRRPVCRVQIQTRRGSEHAPVRVQTGEGGRETLPGQEEEGSTHKRGVKAPIILGRHDAMQRRDGISGGARTQKRAAVCY